LRLRVQGKWQAEGVAMLGLAAWRPNDAKVVAIDAHPTQPWIAFGDLKATLTVWDWRAQEVLYEVTITYRARATHMLETLTPIVLVGP